MGALSSFLGIGSRRGAYVALAVLTSVWGANWVMMKLALEGADPVVFNVQRTWVAIAVLFAAMAAMRAAWAFFEAYLKIASGQADTALVYGSTPSCEAKMRAKRLRRADVGDTETRGWSTP